MESKATHKEQGMQRVTPQCCEQVEETGSVFLVVPDSFVNGDLATKPKWGIVAYHPQWETTTHILVDYCPHCGERLPAVVPVEPKGKVCLVTDGGYYCETCKKRLSECQCLPPAFRWGPNVYDPNFGDERECRCGHPYYRHFDGYENNAAVGCKYCSCRVFVAAQVTAECKHEFKPLTDKQLADKWMSVSATCIHCKNDFGWRCIKSPDGACHYYTTDDEPYRIELIDGTLVEPPAEYGMEEKCDETADHCIYCGMPDERK